MSDEDWFAQEMAKVQPLKQEKSRVQAAKPKRKHEILRTLEEKEISHHHNFKQQRSSAKRTEQWQLRADGVAAKEVSNLAKSNIRHELDLHGMTQDEAIAQMQQFVASAIAQNIRQICIVHGRGNHSTGKSILKETTYHWLEQGPFSGQVLAVTPSTQSRGGACNVLLRKQPSSF